MARPINSESAEKPDVKKKEYVLGVGRRLEAVARVRLYSKESIQLNDLEMKKGEIYVNSLPALKYFGSLIAEVVYLGPLKATSTLGKFIISIKVEGGGKSGQLGAVVHGIARALNLIDREKYHSVLRKNGFLTRDSRIRQRRKVGMGGKSRRKKQSPKR